MSKRLSKRVGGYERQRAVSARRISRLKVEKQTRQQDAPPTEAPAAKVDPYTRLLERLRKDIDQRQGNQPPE